MSEETTENETITPPIEALPEPAPESIGAPATPQPSQAGSEEPESVEPSAEEGVDQPPAQPAEAEPAEASAPEPESPPESEAPDRFAELEARLARVEKEAQASEWKAMHATLRTRDGYRDTVEALFAGKDPRNAETREAIQHYAAAHPALFESASPALDRPSIDFNDYLKGADGKPKRGSWAVSEENIKRTMGLV